MPESVTRRNLPHWYVPGATHFVTCRLSGSVPFAVTAALNQRKTELLHQKPREGESPASRLERIHQQVFAAYDNYLDHHRDVTWLADPRVAAQVRSNLYHLHGRKCYLFAYAIMPNHLHLLAQPLESSASSEVSELTNDSIGEVATLCSPLSTFMHSLKSYTAHEANRLLARSGEFWQHESYDHWVRDDDELERIVIYIGANPVKPGLVSKPHEWFWCSAHDRFLSDGTETAWMKFT
jgi:putative transposase